MESNPAITRATRLMNTDVWAEVVACPREDWKQEVLEGNTQLGYWDWVFSNLE